MRGLERKVLLPWFGAAFLASLILTALGILIQVVVFGQLSAFLTASSLLVFTSLSLLYTARYFRGWRFEMREDYLYLERGVLKRVKSKVPYVRVQHVDTQRGPIYRVFGLSKVVVYTAGSRGADVGIPGLLPDEADEIQEHLRKVAVDSEEDFGDAV